MPQTPVTSKTLMTRQDRRTVLRYHLRDTGSTVFPDAVLNAALNEALTLVVSRYPWIERSLVAGTISRLYDLPEDFVRLVRLMTIEADGEGAVVTGTPAGRVLAAMAKSGTTDLSPSATTSAHVLVLDQPVGTGVNLLIVYEAARQPWGDITLSGSGTDLLEQDLCPGELTDGEAELLFYAAARCAALRYALGYIKSDGGDDWAQQYEYALAERDRLLAQTARGTSLRLTSGLFG